MLFLFPRLPFQIPSTCSHSIFIQILSSRQNGPADIFGTIPSLYKRNWAINSSQVSIIIHTFLKYLQTWTKYTTPDSLCLKFFLVCFDNYAFDFLCSDFGIKTSLTFFKKKMPKNLKRKKQQIWKSTFLSIVFGLHACSFFAAFFCSDTVNCGYNGRVFEMYLL